MSERMTTIAIFGNNWQQAHLSELGRFFKHLASMPVTVYVHNSFADYLEAEHLLLPNMMPVSSVPEDTGIVVSIGGDGTFLRAADWIGCRPIPIMGINTGHLGYLAGFSLARPEQVMDAILYSHYDETCRMRLEVAGDHIPEEFTPYALNEVSISKGDTTSMVSIRAYVDDRFIAEYLADGLIIATPTGSTAYNLSCGGPILQPTMQSFVLTPIAPHSLTLRPLIIDAASELHFEVRSRGEECHVGVDGRTFTIPSDGAIVKLTRAPHGLKVAQPFGSDFASVLRSKLAWGS